MCYVFFQNLEIWIFGNFLKFLDGFFSYLAQIITSVWGSVAYNDLWPWPISSRSFGLGLGNRVRSVASTVPDGFFSYLAQMITSMRRRVAYDDLWPWPISSRSFGLDLENRVRSVASTVLDGFFLYLAQMITIIRGCGACYVFFSKSENLNFWQIFEIFRPWLWKEKSAVLDGFFPYLVQMITSVRGVLHVMTFELDLYLQGHLALALKIVSAL